MGLMDSLRRAEEEGKTLARRGMDKARTAAENAERSARRHMRVHPRPSTPTAAAQKPEAKDPAAEGIVSINGRDLDAEELDKLDRDAA